MPQDRQYFWRLRSTGRLSEARAIFLDLQKAGAEADLALMRVSLLRADEGGLRAAAELARVEPELIPDFQLYYQKALNAFAQARYPESLEHLLKAESFSKEPWENLLLLTARLTCLDNLAFPVRSTLLEIEKKMVDALPEGAAAVQSVVRMVRAHELFREGNFREILALFEEGAWTQVESFGAWVAALPYADIDSRLVERGLDRLTRDADFYLRNYRLQTLVGRVHESPGRLPATWQDRADRLYLWTWRWLADPSAAHAQSLSAVLLEFEAWDGSDVLTVEDAWLIRLALSWILLFEPRFRSRWSALLRRVAATPGLSPPLFSFELLWIEYVRASLAKDAAAVLTAEGTLAKHPLYGKDFLQFREVLSPRLIQAEPSEERLRVDPETGEIFRGSKRVVISEPLAQLLALLASKGRASFAEALRVCFGIEVFDAGMHDAKIQNLLMRARKILESKNLVTRNRWIFLEEASQLISIEGANAQPRLLLAGKVSPPDSRERVRNERSLSVLLKEANSLRGRDVTRLELETVLSIPKATLNRYLRAWIARGWLCKHGSGRNIRYRITFFES